MPFVPGMIGGLLGGGGAAAATTGIEAGAAGAGGIGTGIGLAGAGGYTAAAAAPSLGSILTGVGAATTVAGAVGGQMARNKAAEFNAKEVKLEEAQTAQQEQAKVQQQELQTAAIVGQQDANYGAAGVTEAGTPERVKASTQAIGKYDINTTIQNYHNQQQALATQQAGYKASEVSPFLTGGASGIQAVAQMNNQKYNTMAVNSGMYPFMG